MLSGLRDCKVQLLDNMSALYVDKLENCTVYAGPCSGAVHIEECTNCTFVVACHQMRIHTTTETTFSILVRSNPIIEKCSKVGFCPYVLTYDGIDKQLATANLSLDQNKWDNVQDFNWLRAQQSTNWNVVPEGERPIVALELPNQS
eukprot:GFYU01007361.1.p2 GENE.GFYU01007361.1~~GFYU01007361.1.p2  ORF type:complete len:146 (+),score=18.91 GFYU01007361.1:3-440(+)